MIAQPVDSRFFDSLGPEVLRDLGVVAGALVLAYVLSALLSVGAARLTARTDSDLDDAIFAELQPPLFLALLALAVWASLDNLHLPARLEYLVAGAVFTAAAVVGGRGLYRSALLVIRALAGPDRVRGRLPARLVPLAEYVAQLAVWFAALYGILVAWDLEAALLSTSAGVLGLAVGLAAEGSLSNVVAGLFVQADRACRIGDWLVLDGGDRGRVTHVGLRSIRVLTNDGIEINVPNGLFGGAQVVNESAGPAHDIRLSTTFVLPLTVDLERVRGLITEASPALRHLSPGRPFEFRALAVGERGVQVAVFFWIADPGARVPAFDVVNCWLYERLTAAGVEFALPQHVVHVDAVPAVLSALAAAGPHPRRE